MADDFKDIRFPTNISKGAIGGLQWPLRRVRNSGGFVFRDPLALQPLGSWEVSHVIRRPPQYKLVRNFWMVTNGGAYGFRFKDWTDFTVEASESAFVTIDGTHSRLAKRYSIYGESFDRELQKIVASTFVPSGGSGLTLDEDTGILTHSGLPGSFTCEFDCPCIFGTDEMRAETIEIEQGTKELLIGWSNIPIQLIRLRADES